MATEPSKKASVPNDLPRDSIEAVEAEVDKKIGSLLPQKARREIVSQLTAMVVSESFAGPIAHPRHLREYEAISPGAADRIIQMAEKRSDHQMNMERSVLDAEEKDQRLGMLLGAGLFALLILAALWVALVTGNPVLSGVFLTAAALGGLGLFIKGRNGK